MYGRFGADERYGYLRGGGGAAVNVYGVQPYASGRKKRLKAETFRKRVSNQLLRETHAIL